MLKYTGVVLATLRISPDLKPKPNILQVQAFYLRFPSFVFLVTHFRPLLEILFRELPIWSRKLIFEGVFYVQCFIYKSHIKLLLESGTSFLLKFKCSIFCLSTLSCKVILYLPYLCFGIICKSPLSYRSKKERLKRNKICYSFF